MRGSVFRRRDRRTGRLSKTWTIIVPTVTVGPDGKRQRRQRWVGGFKTKKAAEARLAELVVDVGRGTFVEPTKATVAEYVNEWLNGRANLRPSTWESYRSVIAKWVVPTLGAIPLQHLSPEALDALYAKIRSAGRSGRTAQLTHTIIRKCLADAVRRGHLLRNVADLATRPKGVAREMTTWTAEQVRAFLDHVRDDRLYPAWVLAVNTGLRRGELLGLRWSDVDLDAGRVSIRQTLITVDYKLVVSEPKTPKSRRSIDLDAATVSVLRAHRKAQLEERMAWGEAYTDSGLAFTREDGSPTHPDRFSDAFDQRVAASGLPRIRFHDLRHTHATLGLAAGVPAKVMQERLGHSSISITMDTYTHAIPALQKDAADRIAALINGA